MNGAVAKEDALGGSELELMLIVRSKIREASTTKDFELRVVGLRLVRRKKGE